MPLAQSSELPPPSATSESMPCARGEDAAGFHHFRIGVRREVVEGVGCDAGFREERACA